MAKNQNKAQPYASCSNHSKNQNKARYNSKSNTKKIQQLPVGRDADRIGNRIAQKEELQKFLNQSLPLTPEACLILITLGIMLEFGPKAAGAQPVYSNNRNIPQPNHHDIDGYNYLANQGLIGNQASMLPPSLINRALNAGGLPLLNQLSNPNDPLNKVLRSSGVTHNSAPHQASIPNNPSQSTQAEAAANVRHVFESTAPDQLVLFDAINTNKLDKATQLIDNSLDLELEIEGRKYTTLSLLVEKATLVNANSELGRKLRDLFIKVINKGIDPSLQPSLPKEIMEKSFLAKRYEKVLADKKDIKLKKRQQAEQQRFKNYIETYHPNYNFEFPADVDYFGLDNKNMLFVLYKPIFTTNESQKFIALSISEKYQSLMVEISKPKIKFANVEALISSDMPLKLVNGESILFAVRYVEVLNLIVQTNKITSYSPKSPYNDTPLARLISNFLITYNALQLRLEDEPRYILLISDFIYGKAVTPEEISDTFYTELQRVKPLIARYLELGASPNEINADGNPLIFDIIATRDIELFELLLQQNDLDINVKNTAGRTVLEQLVLQFGVDQFELAAKKNEKLYPVLRQAYAKKIKLALHHGANISFIDDESRTTINEILAQDWKDEKEIYLLNIFYTYLWMEIARIAPLVLVAGLDKVHRKFIAHSQTQAGIQSNQRSLSGSFTRQDEKNNKKHTKGQGAKDRRSIKNASNEGKEIESSAEIKDRIEQLQKSENKIYTLILAINESENSLTKSFKTDEEAIDTVATYSEVKDYIERTLRSVQNAVPNDHALRKIERDVTELSKKEKDFKNELFDILNWLKSSMDVLSVKKKRKCFILSSDSVLKYIALNLDSYEKKKHELTKLLVYFDNVKMKLDLYKAYRDELFLDVETRNKQVGQEKKQFETAFNQYKKNPNVSGYESGSRMSTDDDRVEQERKRKEEIKLSEEEKRKRKKEVSLQRKEAEAKKREEKRVAQAAAIEAAKKEDGRLKTENEIKETKQRKEKVRENKDKIAYGKFVEKLERPENEKLKALFYSQDGYEQIIKHTKDCLEVIKDIHTKMEDLYFDHYKCSSLDNKISWIERIEFYGLIYGLTRASDFLKLTQAKLMANQEKFKFIYLYMAGIIRNNLMHRGFMLRKEKMSDELRPYANIIVHSIEPRLNKILPEKFDQIDYYDFDPYDTLHLSKKMFVDTKLKGFNVILDDISRYLDDLILFDIEIEAMKKQEKMNLGFTQANAFQYAIKGVLQLLAQRLKDFELFHREYYVVMMHVLKKGDPQEFVDTVKKARDAIGHTHIIEFGGEDASNKFSVFEEVSEEILINACAKATAFKEAFKCFKKWICDRDRALVGNQRDTRTEMQKAPGENSVFSRSQKGTVNVSAKTRLTVKENEKHSAEAIELEKYNDRRESIIANASF